MRKTKMPSYSIKQISKQSKLKPTCLRIIKILTCTISIIFLVFCLHAAFEKNKESPHTSNITDYSITKKEDETVLNIEDISFIIPAGYELINNTENSYYFASVQSQESSVEIFYIKNNLFSYDELRQQYLIKYINEYGENVSVSDVLINNKKYILFNVDENNKIAIFTNEIIDSQTGDELYICKVSAPSGIVESILIQILNNMI